MALPSQPYTSLLVIYSLALRAVNKRADEVGNLDTLYKDFAVIHVCLNSVSPPAAEV